MINPNNIGNVDKSKHNYADDKHREILDSIVNYVNIKETIREIVSDALESNSSELDNDAISENSEKIFKIYKFIVETIGMSAPDMDKVNREALEPLVTTILSTTGLILEQNAKAANPKNAETSYLDIPRTWNEAKAQVPGLMKWATAHRISKKTGVDKSIVDHLRDTEYGLGKWACSVQGLPLKNLRKIDESAADALQDWKLENKIPIPLDLNIPNRSELAERAKMPGERPVHVDWALKSRASKER